MKMIHCFGLLVLSVCSLPLFAQEAVGKQEASSVTVRAMRDPVDKSYRRMLDGMKLFEKMRDRAPNATLRYKLLPRDFDVDMDSIVLKVVGDTFSYRVPIAEDQTFTLDIDPRATLEDASVRPNRRAGSMTWRVDIRTPSLPKNVRRLGDLRLECFVGIEAGLTSSGINAVELALLKASHFCDSEGRRSGYYFFAEKPIFSIRLRYQNQREDIPLEMLYAGTASRYFLDDISEKDCRAMIYRTYFLKLGDKRWPDDTLLEFEYMEDEQVSENAKAINLEQGEHQ